jgi:hypothetical protein
VDNFVGGEWRVPAAVCLLWALAFEGGHVLDGPCELHRWATRTSKHMWVFENSIPPYQSLNRRFDIHVS